MHKKRMLTVIRLLALSALASSLMSSGCGSSPTSASPSPTSSSTSIQTPTIPLFPASTSTPTVGPGGFPRRFHVEGNAFVDQFGEQMVFRGVNMAAPMQLLKYPAPSQLALNEHFFQVMAGWGTNVVRIPVEPYDIHNFDWNSLFSALDQTVAWAGMNNIYVDFSFHVCGSITNSYFPWNPEHYATTVEEYLDFWNRISERYADNDTVAFYELFNEPDYPTNPSQSQWMDLKGLAEQGISTIRANDPEKIILVGGLYWAYDLSFVEAAPVAGENIGYATHVYPQNAQQLGKSWDVAFGNLSKKYPVFASEIGYDDFHFSSQQDFRNRLIEGKPYNTYVIDYFESHHISWTVWCFDNIIFTSLLADAAFTPNATGEYFRARLLYEQEGSPKPRPGNFAKKIPLAGEGEAMSNPTLTWAYSVHAEKYEYCIDTISNNICDASWISTGPEEKVALKGLSSGTMYSWQVRATNADGTTYSDGGSWASFTVSRGSNLAFRLPVKASSSENDIFVPGNAVDGDYSTYWGSAFSKPQWIQVDLGTVFDIQRIVIHWTLSYATQYKIQISDDGVNWTTAYSTTTGDGGKDEISVSGRGRYVRIYGDERVTISGNQYGFALYEFEVYGAAGQAPGPVLFRDDFIGSLGQGWHWTNENSKYWSMNDIPGWLQITARQGGIGDNSGENLLFRPVPKGNFELETSLRFFPAGNFQSAGLVIYESPSHYIKFSHAFCGITACVGDGVYFDLITNGAQNGSNFATPAPASGLVFLRLRREGNVFTAYMSEDGTNWTEVGEHQDDIVPSTIGLIAGGTLIADPVPAQFDYFIVYGLT